MTEDVISLADLLLQCESAEQRMSVKNPHRLLLQQCRVALLELAERLRPEPICSDEPIPQLCDCCEQPLGDATHECPHCHVKFAQPETIETIGYVAPVEAG